MTAPLAIVVEDDTFATSLRLARIHTLRQTLLRAAGARRILLLIEIASFAVLSRKSPIPTVRSFLKSDHCRAAGSNWTGACSAEMAAKLV